MVLRQNKIAAVLLIIIGALVPVALYFPVTRAWILALSIAAVGWIFLLPRGWFRGADQATRQILTAFLIIRALMVVIFEFVGSGGGGLLTTGFDSIAYTRAGLRVSGDLDLMGYSASHRSAPGTGAIDLAVGYLYWLGAPVRTAANFLWASASTIGLLLFWSSTKHLAGKRLHLYTASVLLLPTLLFWNSGVGKEAPLILGTAAMVAGIFYAVERGHVAQGIGYFAFGAVLTGLVRPHITFLIIASAAVGIALSSRKAVTVSTGRRVVTFGLLGLALVAIIPVTLQLIDPSGSRSFIDAANERAETNAEIYRPGRSGAGDSTFATSTVRSPVDVPRAIVTVLFRPFPWEVRSVAQAISSLEATVLGLVTLRAVWLIATGRAKFNRTPITITALTYVVLFSIAFVSLGNFGLLVRQRMQVVGFLLVFLFSVQEVVRGVRAEQPTTNSAIVSGREDA